MSREVDARVRAATGAALLWRVKANVGLPVETHYADGSYRSAFRWNSHCPSADRTLIPVRVVEYTLPGVAGADARYRLITTILEPDRAPATELAALGARPLARLLRVCLQQHTAHSTWTSGNISRRASL